MWKKPGIPISIDPSQLVVGLYVDLGISWDDHPFLTSRFRIQTDDQVRTIQALPVKGKLCYFPERSLVQPPDYLPDVAAQAIVEAEPSAELACEIARQNREKHERQRQLQDAATRADRAWENAARMTREAMLGMVNTPKKAGAQLMDLSRQTAKIIAEGQEILLHLLGDKEGDGPQFHALNTMTLAMLLGKVAGMNEGQLSELALGTLAHDIGKARIPLHILKAKNRARHEEDFYRQHGTYGIEMAQISGVFGNAALSVIAEHHEFLDGSGWPTGKKNPGLAARIAALANRYDRLCSPESPEREALMPAEALARIYKLDSAKFDPKLLGIMIKLLGVYPPGTLVRLNDDSLGLVVSPGRDSLRPTVLIYSPETSKKEAPTIDLASATELKIEEAIRPSSLAPDVVNWLRPRQRLSYFYSTEKP